MTDRQSCHRCRGLPKFVPTMRGVNIYCLNKTKEFRIFLLLPFIEVLLRLIYFGLPALVIFVTKVFLDI